MLRQTSSSLLLVASIAGGAGFVAFVGLMLVGGFTVSPAAFLAIILAGAVAVFLFVALHKGPKEDHPDLSPSKDGQLGDRTRKAGTAGVKPGTAGVKPGTAMDQPVNTTLAARTSATAEGPQDGSFAATTAGAAVAASNAPKGSHDGASPTGPDHDDVDPAEVGGRADPIAARADADSGAERPLTAKGTDDAEDTDNGSDDRTDTDMSATAGTTEAEATGSADGADATDPNAGSGTDDHAATQADAPAPAVDDRQKWSSSQVKGTEELAERKGEWRYDAASKASAAAGAGAGGSAAAMEGSTPDTSEPEGTEPVRLDAPRDGGADDLKRIKGIGPKMETMLNDMGFYHYDQIASWSDDELAWVDNQLDGFKGRASRDAWVTQARALAAGDNAVIEDHSDDSTS